MYSEHEMHQIQCDRPLEYECKETEMKLASVQLIISFNFFMGRARTVFEAGLALKTHGSLVNGFTPLRAGRAGFFLSFKFKQPPILKAPFFFSSEAANSM